MSRRPEPAYGEQAQRVLEKLESVRQASAEASEEERREALRQALDRELETVPGDGADPLLAAIRERLIDEARSRARRLDELEQENARLRHQLESAGPSGDRGGESGQLDRIREGLVRLTENKKVTAGSLGLPESDARMFRLIQELFQFALGYEMGVGLLLAEFKIGPAAEMDTKMMQGFKQIVRDRFRACLDNQEGSIEALKETLARNSRFVIELNRAYTSCLFEGSQSLLSEIDPEPILDKHRRMIGFNYEEAWNAIARVQSDLASLTSSELWERFFFESFRKNLSSHLDPDDASS
jgi:hypothetical protein